MKRIRARHAFIATFFGVLIGTASADGVLVTFPRSYAETCPTNPGAPPANFLSEGCGGACAPFADGCCEYRIYYEDYTIKVWTKCNILKECGNLLGVPNGYHCVIPVPPGGGGNN